MKNKTIEIAANDVVASQRIIFALILFPIYNLLLALIIYYFVLQKMNLSSL